MSKVESLLEDLQKAHSRLHEALLLPYSIIHQDATIQRFEFTFELAWKLMQEIIKNELTQESYGPRNAIREAGKLGLINSVELWFTFLLHRNLASHAYDEETATEVYKTAKLFDKELNEFISKVKEYLSDTSL